MPTTVTSTSGVSYHLWQLPTESAPEPSDSHEFSMLENEMSEGHRSTQLFGLDTGIRSWTLPLPTLADTSVIANAVTDPYGATVSRVDYVRNLYKFNRTSGTPFAYQDPNSGQYYLVDMVNPELSMTKSRGVDIYASSVQLRQRRLNGVTIFSVQQSGYSTGVTSYSQFEGVNVSAPNWNVSGGSTGSSMSGSGDVTKVLAGVNGEDYARYNNSASTGYTYNGLDDANGIFEVFLVMRMREATFSNNAGICTSQAQTMLLGSSGTTKFANPGLNAYNYTYWLNGTEYAQSNLQAPMNSTWGVVHVRYTTGWATSPVITLGRNDVTDADYAKVDIAEAIMIGGTPLPILVSREITEYLAVKYAITLD